MLESHHIPGTDEATMDRLVALEAAHRIMGPHTDVRALLRVARSFTEWLDRARDQSERVVSREVLLMVATDRPGLSEREAHQLVGLATDLHKYVMWGLG